MTSSTPDGPPDEQSDRLHQVQGDGSGTVLLEETAEAFGAYSSDIVNELDRLDVNVYAAVAASPTPTIDRALRNLTKAADHGVLWFSIAGLLALVGGRRGRLAAIDGVASLIVSSIVANIGVKPLLRRKRPDRELHGVIITRQVPLPTTTSFPSGHTASAFAFATGVGRELPLVSVPLRVLAALVGWSRVHTGVHYPGDVVVGGMIGSTIGGLVGGAAQRIERRVERRRSTSD